MHDRTGAEFKLTEARWQRYTPAAQAVRGLGQLAARRARPRGGPLPRGGRLLDEQSPTADAAVDVAGDATRRERTRPHIVETTDEVLVVKAVERKSGLAQTHRLRRALFDSNDYRQFVKVTRAARRAGRHAAVQRRARRARRRGAARSRRCAPRCSRSRGSGVNVSALQGPGRDERRPAARDHDGPDDPDAAQVTIDDAAEADRLFSMLMGDAGRAAARVHRAERPRGREPRRLMRRSSMIADEQATDVIERRQHRAARARRRDAHRVPRLRDVGHRRARAARRPRRPQARPPPRPVRDERGGPRPDAPVRQVRAHRRRRDGQLPPARRRVDLRHARAHGAGLLDAPPARRRPGQLRLDRRRPAGRHAVHGGAARRASRREMLARHRHGHGRLRAQLRRRRSRSRRSCRRASRTCSSTARPGIAVGMATNIPPHNLARGHRRDGRLHRRPGDRRSTS